MWFAKLWRQAVIVRRFRTVSLGRKRVDLEVRIPRLACQDCGTVRQAAIGFAEPKRTYTKSFARYVLKLSQHMTIKDVACHLGVSFRDPEFLRLKILGIHETTYALVG